MMKTSRRPSPFAAWLVRQMFPDQGGSSVLGDMTETFHEIAGRRGPFRARTWFWGQVIAAWPHFMLEEFRWRIVMLKSYLLVGLRNLRKNGVYSFLNIDGLAVGITAFILISLYVRFELSFDRYPENAGRIYRIIREGRAYTPAALAPAFAEKIPEVSAAVRIIRSPQTLVSRDDSPFLEDNFYWADPGKRSSE